MRRTFSGEQKAMIVREADELGSDRAIELQHALTRGFIARWRREGFGRKLNASSTGSPIERATSSRTEHPMTRCPACRETFPVVGPVPDAFAAHYEDSPECLAVNLRRAL